LQGDKTFAVLGLNIETMDLKVIAVNNTIGYPSYSKLDDKVAYSALDNTMKQVVGVATLNSDKISSSVNPVILINDAQWPVYYATGARILGFSPKSNFTSSYKSGVAPLSTAFFDQSTNEPTAWEWTFESGNPHTSTAQNPVVTYSLPGTYAVTLKTTNGFGNNTITKSGYIVVSNVTGVNEITSADKIKVFPNPTVGLVEISFEEPLESDYKIEVYNYLGRLIQTNMKQKSDQLSDIDLSGNPAGLYLIIITLKDRVFQSRIMKK